MENIPSEVTVKIKKYTYIYESTSYRNQQGQPRNKRTTIGKILPNGQKIYKKEYLQRMQKAGTPIQIPENQPQYTTNDIKNSKPLDHGLTNLLQKISDKIGLTNTLNTTIPKHSKQIITLATYLASSADPFMYCQEWQNNTNNLPNIGSLSSQRISDLLYNITYGEREAFYQIWSQKRTETEYLALDITSTSTYSDLIGDAEWGYNRDGEKLPQINLCMLMGETSHLPIYQTTYLGSMNDVVTLQTTLAKFEVVSQGKLVTVIMDKGFFSKKNVNWLLEHGQGFVIAVPFSSNFAGSVALSVLDGIDCFDNLLLVGKDSLRAVSVKVLWDGKREVFVHVFFNPLRALQVREKLYADVMRMREDVEKNPSRFVEDKMCERFFEFVEGDEGCVVAVFREGSLERACRFAGVLVLLSDRVEGAVEALRVYRDRDVVEKGFERLKGSLDLGRLRVHGDCAVQNKFFVGFVSLVLLSYVHRVMVEKDLYKIYTLKELLRVLSKFRVYDLNGIKIKAAATKEVREIYKAFEFTDEDL